MWVELGDSFGKFFLRLLELFPLLGKFTLTVPELLIQSVDSLFELWYVVSFLLGKLRLRRLIGQSLQFFLQLLDCTFQLLDLTGQSKVFLLVLLHFRVVLLGNFSYLQFQCFPLFLRSWAFFLFLSETGLQLSKNLPGSVRLCLLSSELWLELLDFFFHFFSRGLALCFLVDQLLLSWLGLAESVFELILQVLQLIVWISKSAQLGLKLLQLSFSCRALLFPFLQFLHQRLQLLLLLPHLQFHLFDCLQRSGFLPLFLTQFLFQNSHCRLKLLQLLRLSSCLNLQWLCLLL